MITDLREKEKMILKKTFLRCEKTQRYKKKELFSIRTKLTYYKENLLAIEMKKNQICMDKPVYLGLLELSKIVMYEF